MSDNLVFLALGGFWAGVALVVAAGRLGRLFGREV